MWHYSKRAGHEVPGVVAVLCECMGGYREGDMLRIGLSVPFACHLKLRCAKVAKTKTKQNINAKKIKAPKSSMCQKQQELNYWFNNVKVNSGR